MSCLYSALYLLPCAADGAFFFPFHRQSPVHDLPLDLLEAADLELQKLPIAVGDLDLLLQLPNPGIHRRPSGTPLVRRDRLERRRNDLPLEAVEVGAGQPQDPRAFSHRKLPALHPHDHVHPAPLGRGLSLPSHGRSLTHSPPAPPPASFSSSSGA